MSRVMFTASLILVVACMAFVYAYFSPVSSAQNANNQQNRKFQSVERGPGKKMAVDKAGIQRLKDRTGGTVNVATSEATGAARFITIPKASGRSWARRTCLATAAGSALPCVPKIRLPIITQTGTAGTANNAIAICNVGA